MEMQQLPWLALTTSFIAVGCGHEASRACTSCDAAVGPDSSALCVAGQPGDFLADACILEDQPRDFAASVTIDTNIGAPMCEGYFRSPYCMLSGTTITLRSGVVVYASGTRPLLLLAHDTIDIEGRIDVGSHRTPSEQIGASADDPRCATPTGGSDPVGGGGGAGGSFTFFGGGGGAVGAIPDGQPVPGTTPVDLHGGCSGGKGGDYQGSGGGAIGHSGGAVYLMAGTSITLGTDADLLANGEGGGKAGTGAGGGGGGSGGMIVLDAPRIMLSTGTRVVAEGGGGGGGGDLGSGAGDGFDGAGPIAAIGGAAASPAGTGGPGSVASGGGNGGDGPIDPTTSTGGGGGGGGASGHVIVFGKIIGSGTFSPPPEM